MSAKRLLSTLRAGTVGVLTLALHALALHSPKLHAQPALPNVITVEVGDYAFITLPKTVPAGLTTIRLVNKGKTLHHLQLNRLTGGKTVTDMLRDFRGGFALPSYMRGAGGPSAAWAGQTIEATTILEPGTYGVICWVPAFDHQLHLQKGMFNQIEVVADPRAKTAALPKADVTITSRDYGYEFNTPITVGTRTIRFENKGPQSHELVLVKLAPGKTMVDARDWAERGQTGERPGEMLNGVAAIAPGASASITNRFTPGEYALICFVPDDKDKKGLPHVHYGMMRQFTVK